MRLVLPLALVTLITAACGGAATTEAATTTETAPVETAPVETATGTTSAAAPSPLMGQFERIAGETIDLSDFEGENVLFWFWEPW